MGTGKGARSPRLAAVISAVLSPAMNCLFIWFAIEASLALGRRTALGPGLLGATVPLLVLEAWVTARRHWRARLFCTLGVAVPMFSLLTFLTVFPSSCCMRDQSPSARALRDVEFIWDFVHCDALATLPVFALLAVLRRRSAPPAERRAYAVATQSGMLAVLLGAVTFGGLIYWLRSRSV